MDEPTRIDHYKRTLEEIKEIVEDKKLEAELMLSTEINFHERTVEQYEQKISACEYVLKQIDTVLKARDSRNE